MAARRAAVLIAVVFGAGVCAAQYGAGGCQVAPRTSPTPAVPADTELLRFALNLEHVEAEWFLFGSMGYGLDVVDSSLAMGGPPPAGAQRASLNNRTRSIFAEFGYQQVGHLRAIKTMVGRFQRPQIDLSPAMFARLMNDAMGEELDPPFNPYHSTLKFILASYLLPYLGVGGYAGAIPSIIGSKARKLVGGLMAVEAGQDAVIRSILYENAERTVKPYENYTVADFTERISAFRDRVGGCGGKDEGVMVEQPMGAERRMSGNVLAADANSLAFDRSPAEVLRILYGSGDERRPGGFLPSGGNGKIAKGFLIN